MRNCNELIGTAAGLLSINPTSISTHSSQERNQLWGGIQFQRKSSSGAFWLENRTRPCPLMANPTTAWSIPKAKKSSLSLRPDIESQNCRDWKGPPEIIRSNPNWCSHAVHILAPPLADVKGKTQESNLCRSPQSSWNPIKWGLDSANPVKNPPESWTNLSNIRQGEIPLQTEKKTNPTKLSLIS